MQRRYVGNCVVGTLKELTIFLSISTGVNSDFGFSTVSKSSLKVTIASKYGSMFRSMKLSQT